MKPNPYAILLEAEKFVTERGVHNWFREHYSRRREVDNVVDSVIGAMRDLDLEEEFLTKFDEIVSV